MNGRWIERTSASLVLVAVFFRELALSSVAVARAAFAREAENPSAIIAVPMELKTDLGIALLANLVTLTPGTSSLHVSDDKRILYVHALDGSDPDGVIAGIKSAFEERIRRIEP